MSPSLEANLTTLKVKDTLKELEHSGDLTLNQNKQTKKNPEFLL